MRHFCVLALTAAATLGAGAESLTPARALERLERSSVPAGRLAPGLKPRLVASLPELYVFSHGADGYMVLPADDVAAPLLGYSEAGAFDPAGNPALAYWLESYARQIEYARESGAPVYAGDVARVSRPAIAPMVETRWNQDAPYNDLCPELDGARSVTGCVATAMAQVMRFHRWPQRGTGTHSYEWTTGGKTLSFDYGATTFDWDGMLPVYGEDATAGQRSAVATLMYAAGVSVDMNYTPQESGAVSRNMGPALLDRFGYDRSLWMPQRDYYGLEEWEDMIYAELAAGRPVLYGGTGSAGGHQFVCDGYSTDGYFHFNWGWGGQSDGYFLLTALDPPSLGIGGGAGGFNYNQSALLNVMKPRDGSQPVWPVYCGGNFTVGGESAALGVEVAFGGGFYNYGFTDIPAGMTLGLKVSDAGGKVSYLEGAVLDKALPAGYGTQGFAVKFPADMPAGSYTVEPAYRLPGGEWQTVRAKLSDNSMFEATVSGSEIRFSAPDAPMLAVSSLAAATPLYWGSPFKLTFTLANEGRLEYYGSVTPVLMVEEGSGVQVIATSSPYPVELAAGGSADAVYEGTFTATSGVPAAGTYLLGLLDTSGRGLVGEPVEVTLNSAPESTSISVTGFRMADESEPMEFAFDVVCDSGYFAGTLTLAVFPATGGRAVAEQASAMQYVEAGQIVAATVSVDLSSLPAGEYMAALFGMGKQVTDAIPFNIKASELSVVEAGAGMHAAAESYYTLDGRLAGTDAGALQPGVYVTSSGRKMLKRR